MLNQELKIFISDGVKCPEAIAGNILTFIMLCLFSIALLWQFHDPEQFRNIDSILGKKNCATVLIHSNLS